MNAVVSIDVAFDGDQAFSANGRQRRAAVARTLRRVFSGEDWKKDDSTLESVFDAVEIEHRFEIPAEGATVTVTERPAPGLRLVTVDEENHDREQGKETAREILLYLEAVAMTFADRKISDSAGIVGMNTWYEGLLPWSEAVRRVFCARTSKACADLAAMLDGDSPSAEEGRLAALGILETVAETLRRLEKDLGGLRLALGEKRFRETASWSGSPARVRGVYRPSVWEKTIREFASELGDEEADFMYECIRDHRSVWPLGLEFTADFFSLALRLFRLVAEQGELLTELAAPDQAPARYPVCVEKSV
jgi:hypothetical protein